MGGGVVHVEQRSGPTIKNLRERFVTRPTISKAQTARKPRMIDLVVG